MIPYRLPEHWLRYDPAALVGELVEATAKVEALRTVPYQRDWVEALQALELKREVAGTSRIEGAEFSDAELDAALAESPEKLHTRSQRQAHAAVNTYRWIATLPPDRPADEPLILEIHRRIVTGADDDHCEPGRLRGPDHNVNFGQPRHRGAAGGQECASAFRAFVRALTTDFRAHPPLLSALAAHCHLAAIHPFMDGNGRAARALEALLLQRAGLRDTCFIAMSNYYYEEKPGYLAALAESARRNHDLTPFFKFALAGVAAQARRMLDLIQTQVAKALFRNMMHDLFGRLKSTRRRVLAKRQLDILSFLLKQGPVALDLMYESLLRGASMYGGLKNARKALLRDLSELVNLGAIRVEEKGDGRHYVSVRLDWPQEMNESKFAEYLKRLPKAKSPSFLD